MRDLSMCGLIMGVDLQADKFTRQSFLPLLYSVFSVIFMANFIGLGPYTLTVTSQVLLPAALACVSFFGLNFEFLLTDRTKFLKLFSPCGAPLFILPLLIPIEILSYVSRVISLSVRLFANMTSGHALLKILSFFFLLVGGSATIISFSAPLIFVVILLITILEAFIAALQSYVFSVLVSLYIADLLNMGSEH